MVGTTQCEALCKSTVSQRTKPFFHFFCRTTEDSKYYLPAMVSHYGK